MCGVHPDRRSRCHGDWRPGDPEEVLRQTASLSGRHK